VGIIVRLSTELASISVLDKEIVAFEVVGVKKGEWVL
jgi:hypothetical protein